MQCTWFMVIQDTVSQYFSLFIQTIFKNVPSQFPLWFITWHLNFVTYGLWGQKYYTTLGQIKKQKQFISRYFRLLQSQLCKCLVVPWALSHVCYVIDQKPSRYSQSARFRCDWFLDNKNNVIGKLRAYRIFETFKSGMIVFICILLKWKYNWKEHAHKQLHLTKYIEYSIYKFVG